MQYVSTAGSEGDCIFCVAASGGDDEATYVLYRGPSTFVLLNAFPYNTGHVMVAPLRHVADPSDLAGDERAELMDLVIAATDVIGEEMSAHGFNVGMNLGVVAGAGIPGHLHMHVVPRWGGDTNFMTTVGETKVLPEMLADTARRLRPLFGARGRPSAG